MRIREYKTVSAAAWSLLCRRRPSWALSMFRLTGGVALALHFLGHARDSARWIADGGLYEAAVPDAFGIVALSARWLTARSNEALTLLFYGAAAGAALVAAGIFPRLVSAALFFIAIATQKALLPVGMLDDYLAVAMLFWLIVLSSSEAPWSRAFWSNGASSPSGAAIVAAFNAYVLLLYVLLGLGLLEGATPRWPDARWPLLGCYLMPALFFVPGRLGRAMGAAVQLTLHAFLLFSTGLVVSHLLMAATAFVLWTRDPLAGSRSESGRVPSLDAASVVALCHPVLLAIVFLTPAAVSSRSTRATARLLSDAGLLPRASSYRLPQVALALEVRVPGEPVRRERPEGVRSQLLLKHMTVTSSSEGFISRRDHIPRTVLRSFCAKDGRTEGSARIVVPDDAPIEWSFTCSEAGELLGATPAPKPPGRATAS